MRSNLRIFLDPWHDILTGTIQESLEMVNFVSRLKEDDIITSKSPSFNRSYEGELVDRGRIKSNEIHRTSYSTIFMQMTSTVLDVDSAAFRMGVAAENALKIMLCRWIWLMTIYIFLSMMIWRKNKLVRKYDLPYRCRSTAANGHSIPRIHQVRWIMVKKYGDSWCSYRLQLRDWSMRASSIIEWKLLLMKTIRT